MLIGRGLYSAAPFAWATGLIDDARVYNRVLTAAEIATISAYPTGVTTTEASPTSASLTWSAFPSATSYNLYRSTSAGTEGGTAYQTGLASPSYTDTGLTAGTSYYYKVAAVTASGESAHSNEAALTPVAAPTGVTATPGSAQVALAWTASAGATSYSVRRAATPGGPYTQVGDADRHQLHRLHRRQQHHLLLRRPGRHLYRHQRQLRRGGRDARRGERAAGLVEDGREYRDDGQ